MKTTKTFSIFALIAASALAVSAQAVEVEFLEPTDFTDFTASSLKSEKSQKSYIEDLTRHLESRLAHQIAPHHVVQIVITDVDMAGEFEPWRRAGLDDVRIVKDLYPPRIDLSFQVLDDAGEVVRAGERKLRDLGFMYTVHPTLSSDPLRHEKELLNSWVRREFKDLYADV